MNEHEWIASHQILCAHREIWFTLPKPYQLSEEGGAGIRDLWLVCCKSRPGILISWSQEQSCFYCTIKCSPRALPTLLQYDSLKYIKKHTATAQTRNSMFNGPRFLRISKLSFPSLFTRHMDWIWSYHMGQCSCQGWSRFKTPGITFRDLHPCLLGKILEKTT